MAPARSGSLILLMHDPKRLAGATWPFSETSIMPITWGRRAAKLLPCRRESSTAIPTLPPWPEIGYSFSLMNEIPNRTRFELRRLAEYSDEAIIAELRRVAVLAPNGAFLESDFERLGRVGRNTIRRRFGSWLKALGAAGLAHRSTHQIKTRGGHASSRMSDDEIIAMLKELAGKLGR